VTGRPVVLEPIQRVSVTDAVLEQLKRLVLNGQLGPGDRIPSERELCSRLEVSRTALREAKKALVAMGLLDAKPGQGTFIKDDLLDFISEPIDLGLRMEPMRMYELVEARAIVETASAALAARRATDADKRALEQIMDRQSTAVRMGDIDAFLEADLELHSAIAQAAGNAVLMRVNLAIYGLVRALSQTVLERAPHASEPAFDNHGRVVEAIVAGDPAQARAAMQAHLDDVQDLIEQYFGPTLEHTLRDGSVQGDPAPILR
jgi:GntR family transcriptional repressor for pyruvate dehydrogenase complex